MDKTKKIIAIVAAMLVVCASAIGIGYKLWYGEDMPVVEEHAVVIDSVAVDTLSAVPADTLVLDTIVAE